MVKKLPANAGDLRDMGSIPGLGRFPGKQHGNPLQYSYLENLVDRGAWWVTVLWVTKISSFEEYNFGAKSSRKQKKRTIDAFQGGKQHSG